MFAFIERIGVFMRFLAAGDVFLLLLAGCGWCIQKLLKKQGHLYFLYTLILFSGISAMVLFFIGMLYACFPFGFLLSTGKSFSVMGWRTASGNVNVPILLAFVETWFAGVVWRIREERKNEKEFARLYLLNQPVVDSQIWKMYCDTATKAGVANLPLLFSNAWAQIPFVKGIRNTAVIIPDNGLSSLEQELIFAHELIHCRRHDLILRHFMQFVFDIYWFFPFDGAWMNLFIELQETLCDIEVCRDFQDSFNTGTYYVTIVRLTERIRKEQRMRNLEVQLKKTECSQSTEDTGAGNFSGLFQEKISLEQRMKNVMGYQKGSRRKETIIALSLSFCMLFLTEIMMGIFNPDIFISRETIIRTIEQPSANSGVLIFDMENHPPALEKRMHPDKKKQHIQRGVCASYQVKPGEQICSELFQGSKGEVMVLAMNASFSEYEVRLMNGEKLVSSSKGSQIARFCLKLENLPYRFYVCNTGTENLDMEIYCTKPHGTDFENYIRKVVKKHRVTKKYKSIKYKSIKNIRKAAEI